MQCDVNAVVAQCQILLIKSKTTGSVSSVTDTQQYKDTKLLFQCENPHSIYFNLKLRHYQI